MAIQTVNLGAAANDGTGDNLRSGGTKINANFAELDTRVSAAQSKANEVTPLEARVSVNETAIGQLSNTTNSNTLNISNLSNRTTSLESGQTDLDTRLGTAEGKIAVIEATGGGGTAPAVFPTHKTMTLTKSLFGRHSASALAATRTWNITMELEADAMGFRVGIPNVHSAAVAGVKVSVCWKAVKQTAAWLVDINPDSGDSWYDVTFDDGATSATLAARYYQDLPSWTWSDFVPLLSKPRTDGGTRPILLVRIEMPSGAYASVPLNGIFNWRQNTAPRHLAASLQDVAGVTTKGNYTQTLNTEADILVPAIQYTTKRAGHQVMMVGDSTTEGLGGFPNCYGAPQQVCYENSTPTSPVEYFNGAQHSLWPDVYSRMVINMFPRVKPTILVYSPYSVNEAFVTTGVSVEGHRNMRKALARVLGEARDTGRPLRLILLEGLPVNAAGKDLGPGDSTRTAINAWLNTLDGPIIAAGYASAISGTADPDGQIQIASGLSDDNLHPNAQGYAELADVLRPILLP